MKKIFFKRLFYFSIGLFFGLLFLNFIIDQKTDGKGVDYCYFPNCRVLKDLRKNSDFTVFLKDSVLVEGTVLFNKSETKLTGSAMFASVDVSLTELEESAKLCPAPKRAFLGERAAARESAKHILVPAQKQAAPPRKQVSAVPSTALVSYRANAAGAPLLPNPHQLALSLLSLNVKPSKNAATGAGVIVLHEILANSKLVENFTVPALKEKAATVTEDFGFQDCDALKRRGLKVHPSRCPARLISPRDIAHNRF